MHIHTHTYIHTYIHDPGFPEFDSRLVVRCLFSSIRFARVRSEALKSLNHCLS